MKTKHPEAWCVNQAIYIDPDGKVRNMNRELVGFGVAARYIHALSKLLVKRRTK